MARELKIGDRVVDWLDEAGVVLNVNQSGTFFLRYDNGEESGWGWIEFNPENPDDIESPNGTFRFEDTEYPEWPRS